MMKILDQNSACEVTVEIPGLRYIPVFANAEEQASLLSAIDRQNWLTDLKRRVQHYGYKYDYKARTIDSNSHLGEIPEWLTPTCLTLRDQKIFSSVPDQVIVNEYDPGQGISPHVDCVPCFGDIIASLSLGSSCVMEFSHVQTDEIKTIKLEPGSLIVLKDAARYDWRHAIPARKSDLINGVKNSRQRRVSLTFRNVILA